MAGVAAAQPAAPPRRPAPPAAVQLDAEQLDAEQPTEPAAVLAPHGRPHRSGLH